MKRLKEEIKGLDEADLDTLKRKIKKLEKVHDSYRKRIERRAAKIKAIYAAEKTVPLKQVLATFNAEKETFVYDGIMWRVEQYLDGHGVSVMKSVSDNDKRAFFRFKLNGTIIDCWNSKEYPPPFIIDLVEKLLANGYFKGSIPVKFERK